MQTTTLSSLAPKVVLGIAAHPDDLDFAAGGTMAAFAQQGAQVYYLILTDGGKGSEDRAATSEGLRDMRHNEQRTAGAALGLTDVFFCDFPDGALENTQDVKREIVKAIRRVKPDVVVSIDPTVVYHAQHGFINHPDHRAAGQAALDAVYPLARDHMTFPELLAEGLEPHKTATLLLFDFAHEIKPCAIDVSNVIDQKFQALAAHASQFKNIEALTEDLRNRATQTGQQAGCQYAESFVRIDIA